MLQKMESFSRKYIYLSELQAVLLKGLLLKRRCSATIDFVIETMSPVTYRLLKTNRAHSIVLLVTKTNIAI